MMMTPLCRRTYRSFLSCGVVGALLTGGCASSNRGAPRGQPAGVNYYIQGLQQAKAGNDEQAIASLERAVEINPDLRMAQAMLGDAYRAQGNYEKAAAHYQAA